MSGTKAAKVRALLRYRPDGVGWVRNESDGLYVPVAAVLALLEPEP